MLPPSLVEHRYDFSAHFATFHRADVTSASGEARQRATGSARENGRLTDMSKVTAPVTGTVWKIQVAPGDSVVEGQTLVILESMKMEMPVEASEPGKVTGVAVKEGQAVEEGDLLLSLD